MTSYCRALEINPGQAFVFSKLGNALADLGRLDEAVASYRRAIAIKADYAEVHGNLGNALRDLGRIDDAMASYRRVLKIRPDYAEAHCNLGSALRDLGRLDDAVESYRRALEIAPDFAGAHSNLLFSLSHSESADAQAVFAEHCSYADRFEAPLRAHWPEHANSRNPERCLQVGFVSGDLRSHPVANFLEPVLAHLSGHPRLSLHAYCNHAFEDDVTRRLKQHLAHWHPIARLSDAALAQKIREDGIDILFDLSGHTALNRMLTFARKPAPIQITWIGYPNTTGLRAMDYVLRDRFNAPYGVHDRFHVEKVVRLPSASSFLSVAGAPPVNELPARSTGIVTLGSFNSPSKLGDGVIALWSEVLTAVPGSRLLLGGVNEQSLRTTLVQRFSRHGVAAHRLLFQPRVDMTAYLALHHRVDFILDTFPNTGGATTHHALWMGVPVLTMTGPADMNWQCSGLQRRLGLTDWIARDAEDYVRRALDWAHRLDELAGIRAGMRDRLLASPLLQPRTVAKGLATALAMMWRRWCDNQPVESFEVTIQDIEVDSGWMSPGDGSLTE